MNCEERFGLHGSGEGRALLPTTKWAGGLVEKLMMLVASTILKDKSAAVVIHCPRDFEVGLVTFTYDAQRSKTDETERAVNHDISFFLQIHNKATGMYCSHEHA